MDDDIYSPRYVQDAVNNLQGGNVFTAEVDYYVAFPRINDDHEDGLYSIRTGQYHYGQSADDYTWLCKDGRRMQPEADQVLSTLPYGFTYAVRTDAYDAVGGIADILRGEDRSLYLPLLEEYGQDAFNLRDQVSGNLTRLLGDNNSANCVSELDVILPAPMQEQVNAIYGDTWANMLTHKFAANDNAQPASRPEPAKAEAYVK